MMRWDKRIKKKQLKELRIIKHNPTHFQSQHAFSTDCRNTSIKKQKITSLDNHFRLSEVLSYKVQIILKSTMNRKNMQTMLPFGNWCDAG